MAPGEIEIDRSGTETVIRIGQPQESFTVNQLRMYAEYLDLLAREAEAPPPEPDVEALVTVFETIPVRLMTWEAARHELARAVLAAGYKREAGEDAATGTEGAA